MLSKNVDHAIVGHNLFAYFYSLLLLERKQSILLLDDERFNFGDFYTETLTSFDVQLLKKLGEVLKIDSFFNIDNFITPQNHFFFVAKKRVMLGGSFSDNRFELKRKFPDFFQSISSNNEEYEKECASYFDRTIDAIFSDSRWSSLHPFQLQGNEDLTSGFKHFYALLKNNSLDFKLRNELFTLMNMTRGFYQGIVSTRGSEVELFHAFLCLHSPLYSLDHDKIKNSLKLELENRGGEFKKLNLGELKLQSGSIMLESFEGHIKTKKMSFIGGATRDLPIKVKVKNKKFSCLKGNVYFQNIDQEYLNYFFSGQNILFSSVLKVGTDRPFWFGSFNRDHFEVTFIVAEKSGTKESFFHGTLESLINEDFGHIYPELMGSFKLENLRFTHDHLIEDRNFEFSNKLQNVIPNKLLSLFKLNGPNYFGALKNVYYYGPFTNDRLGTFSSVLVLKKVAARI